MRFHPIFGIYNIYRSFILGGEDSVISAGDMPDWPSKTTRSDMGPHRQICWRPLTAESRQLVADLPGFYDELGK